MADEKGVGVLTQTGGRTDSTKVVENDCDIVRKLPSGGGGLSLL